MYSPEPNAMCAMRVHSSQRALIFFFVCFFGCCYTINCKRRCIYWWVFYEWWIRPIGPTSSSGPGHTVDNGRMGWEMGNSGVHCPHSFVIETERSCCCCRHRYLWSLLQPMLLCALLFEFKPVSVLEVTNIQIILFFSSSVQIFCYCTGWPLKN